MSVALLLNAAYLAQADRLNAEEKVRASGEKARISSEIANDLLIVYAADFEAARVASEAERAAAEALRVASEAAEAAEAAAYRASIAAPVTAPLTLFHGTPKNHYFYIYPKTYTLRVRCDTHLPPSDFCSHHNKEGLPLKIGIVRFTCLGHSSKEDFKKAEEEWKHETYSKGAQGGITNISIT